MQVKVISRGEDLTADPRYQRWYEWALQNLRGDAVRAHVAAGTAVAVLRSGADDAAAAAAAQRAALSPSLEQARVRTAAPRRSLLRRFGPVTAVFALITFTFGLLGGLLAAGALWVMEQTWRTTLPAWLRGVLVAFTGLAAVLLYLILTGILELLRRG